MKNNDRYSTQEPIDISMETQRSYVYPNGEKYTIKFPKELFIRNTGGHRVVDGTTAHIIRSGWIAITIPKECLVF